jgi:hypothetical protein
MSYSQKKTLLYLELRIQGQSGSYLPGFSYFIHRERDRERGSKSKEIFLFKVLVAPTFMFFRLIIGVDREQWAQ